MIAGSGGCDDPYLVDNDTLVEITVPLGTGDDVPHVHTHAGRNALLSIGRGTEVGVVHAGTVLRIQLNRITAKATRATVDGLEVASSLSEAQNLQKIVILHSLELFIHSSDPGLKPVDSTYNVRSVEELSSSRVNVLLRVQLVDIIGVVENQIPSTVRSVVFGVIVAAIPVLLGVGIVAPCGLPLGGTGLVPASRRSGTVERVLDQSALTIGRIVDTERAVCMLACVLGTVCNLETY